MLYISKDVSTNPVAIVRMTERVQVPLSVFGTLELANDAGQTSSTVRPFKGCVSRLVLPPAEATVRDVQSSER